MRAAAEKLGNVAGKLGKTLGKMGREAEKLGRMVGKLGTAIRKMGTGAFALGSVAGKTGMGVGKLGTAGGELGTMLRNWGSRPEKCAADGSRPVWGIKIAGVLTLSVTLRIVARLLMACLLHFSKLTYARQFLFEQILAASGLNEKHFLCRSFRQNLRDAKEITKWKQRASFSEIISSHTWLSFLR
jgi:hypothetical protein